MTLAKLAAAASSRRLPVAARDGAEPGHAVAEGRQGLFHQLKNGAVVTSPFLVQFGLSGMGVAPVGVDTNTGHHHLIIDTKLSPEELKAPIAADAKHVHYGAGQTEAMVTLPPGQHTLQLVLGTGATSRRSAGDVGDHHHHGEVSRVIALHLRPMKRRWAERRR